MATAADGLGLPNMGFCPNSDLALLHDIPSLDTSFRDLALEPVASFAVSLESYAISISSIQAALAVVRQFNYIEFRNYSTSQSSDPCSPKPSLLELFTGNSKGLPSFHKTKSRSISVAVPLSRA